MLFRSYKITPSGLTSDNYKISYVSGKLTVKDKTTVIAAKAVAQGKTSLVVSWNQVTDAASYELWATTCSSPSCQKVRTLGRSATSFTMTKLKENTNYRFYVLAKNAAGKTISKSQVGHVATGNVHGKYTNAKSLKVTTPKVTLSKGGTAKIKATQTKAVAGKELLNHRALLRYRSEKPAVATVDENGTIKAVGTGWCRIYVQTVNGLCQMVEVTVK